MVSVEKKLRGKKINIYEKNVYLPKQKKLQGVFLKSTGNQTKTKPTKATF